MMTMVIEMLMMSVMTTISLVAVDAKVVVHSCDGKIYEASARDGNIMRCLQDFVACITSDAKSTHS